MLTLDQLPLSAKARELRQVFDATFAIPPAPTNPPTVALLLVRAGGELAAVRRAEMTGFVRGDAIVLVPGRSPAFAGLAGLRCGLYPVWNLAALLGRSSMPGGAGCWLVLAEANGVPCAFACEGLEKMIFVPEAAVARRDASTGATPGMVEWNFTLVPVVDLPALQADIWKRKESTPTRRPPP